MALKTIMDSSVVKQIQSVLGKDTVPSVYLVGGALRDSWLQRPVFDFDFVVPGDTREVGQVIAKKISAHYVLLDEDWGVVRLIWADESRGGEQHILDFTSMRGESIHDDLCLRDFTCNAMSLELNKDTALNWEDPTGGQEDLVAKTIRMIHPDRLREDPLRLLRAFRLACTLQFDIDTDTLQVIAAQREHLLTAAAERIRDEITKLFSAPDSYATLHQMERAGILATLFPELEKLKGLEQGSYHHLDAWDHTLALYQIIENGLSQSFPQAEIPAELKDAWIAEFEESKTSPKPLIMMAALFHDIGKPLTSSLGADKAIHFYGHARAGADIAFQILKRLRFSRKDQERIKRLIQYHMGPLHLHHVMEKDRLTDKAKLRFLRRIGEDVGAMLLISWADMSASEGVLSTPEKRKSFISMLESLLSLYRQQVDVTAAALPLVTGNDLMQELRLPPGPVIGRLLRLVEEEQILGHIHSRDEAIALARRIIA